MSNPNSFCEGGNIENIIENSSLLLGSCITYDFPKSHFSDYSLFIYGFTLQNYPTKCWEPCVYIYIYLCMHVCIHFKIWLKTTSNEDWVMLNSLSFLSFFWICLHKPGEYNSVMINSAILSLNMSDYVFQTYFPKV